MPRTIVLLTEEALSSADAQRVSTYHREEYGPDVGYRVLVPADTERNLLAEIVDHLSLFELGEALAAARERHPDPREARADADEALRASLSALRATGVPAEGETTEDNPIPALADAVRRFGPPEVVVVTRPHALEDTLHRDWASRARETLGVPVLHLYAGSARLG